MLFNDCKKASIYSLENVFLCDASVSRIRNDSVVLTMKGIRADLLTSEVYVTFFDGMKGLVTHFCELTQYKEVAITPEIYQSSVHCLVKQQISVKQRRNDVKIPVNIPVELSFGKESTAAVLCNLSAGGVFFICRHSFQPGNEVEFSFSPHQGVTPFSLRARILRCQTGDALRQVIGHTADDEEIIGYGCRFVELPLRFEAQIRHFVFREDLNRRKKVPRA